MSKQFVLDREVPHREFARTADQTMLQNLCKVVIVTRKQSYNYESVSGNSH